MLIGMGKRGLTVVVVTGCTRDGVDWAKGCIPVSRLP
jgi:hypothetical protein